MKKVLLVALVTIGSASAHASLRYTATAVDRCSTKDNTGEFDNISLKLDRADKSKALLVGVSAEGYVTVLSGAVVSRKSKTLKSGIRQTLSTIKFEDGSSLKTVELGDSFATATRSDQNFECGD